jgi:hypothetical protein
LVPQQKAVWLLLLLVHVATWLQPDGSGEEPVHLASDAPSGQL